MHSWLIGLAFTLLAGCETLIQRPDAPPAVEVAKPPPPPPPAPKPVEELATYLERIGGASPGELAREYESLAVLPEGQREPGILLRLGLLLSQPGLPFRDDAAALRVLMEWESRQAGADPAVKAFVRWLRTQLGERTRLTAGLDETILRAREEKKRADVCKDKLEALKNMEKSLIERDKQ